MPVPLVAVTVMLPVLPPKQATLVCDVVKVGSGSTVKVMLGRVLAVAEHPLASVRALMANVVVSFSACETE